MSIEIHFKNLWSADLIHHTEIIILVIHVSGSVYNLENVDMEFAYRQYLDIKYINYIP